MNAITTMTGLVERLPLPDALTRAGIAALCARTNRKLDGVAPSIDDVFAREMADRPIAAFTDDANAQHYEVPSAFFAQVLGPQRKYSCCFYDNPTSTLADAEEAALAQTAAHAGLADGQHILELGCGWGSLSLWMARHYPNATIVSVSNSNSQREYIEARAQEQGVTNLRVITADMNVFTTNFTFDRVVSVEMFEHMMNWGKLLAKVKTWLTPEGRLFIHVFTHAKAPYRFELDDKEDWIAQHFFTGGIMPSHGFIRSFGDQFAVEDEWRWSGTHYRRTATDWLNNFDRNIDTIVPILRQVYDKDAVLWQRRWRLFFLATEGLFGFADGAPWGVSHYRLRPVA